MTTARGLDWNGMESKKNKMNTRAGGDRRRQSPLFSFPQKTNVLLSLPPSFPLPPPPKFPLLLLLLLLNLSVPSFTSYIFPAPVPARGSSFCLHLLFLLPPPLPPPTHQHALLSPHHHPPKLTDIDFILHQSPLDLALVGAISILRRLDLGLPLLQYFLQLGPARDAEAVDGP
jgi:hypothetical protein